MKLHIATSRDIGIKCLEWAKESLPEGIELSSMNDCEIFISVMYEELVSEKFIQSKIKCFNFHPGILPKYRGSGAFSWAIINNDKIFGITLHEIDVGIDNGPIIRIDTRPIEKSDTAYSLFKKGEEMIFTMFKEEFNSLLKLDYTTTEQDEASANIYYRKDLEKAKDITCFIKAFYFPGKESAFFYNKKGEKIYINYD